MQPPWSPPIDASDEPTLPEGAEPYFMRFNTEALPFNVCGMSDVMPYFGAKSIGPTPSASVNHAVVLQELLCDFGPSRMRWPFSHRQSAPA